MDNKGPIDLSQNAAIVVVGVVAMVCIAFRWGFSLKTPTGYEFNARRKK